ncbi:MAG: aldo/keto reductase, partial [Chloroflexota bacterium]
VHWALGHPGIFLNTAGDIHLLPKVLDAASRFQSAPTEEAMAEMATKLEMAPLFI